MRTKRLFLLLIVVSSFSLIFFSCDTINGAFDSVFLTAEKVEPAALTDFTGAVAADEDAAMAGFMAAMGLVGDSNPLARALGDDYVELMRVADMVVPGLADTAASRTVSASASAAINDETVTSDFEPGYYPDVDPGTITITKAEVSADAEANSMTNPTSSEANFNVDIEISGSGMTDYSEYNDVTYDYDIPGDTIEDIELNVKAKGNATATLARDAYDEIYPTSIDFYLACDASLGFSFSSTSGGSGIYVINLNYVAAAVLDQTDIAEIQAGDTSSLGEDVSVHVLVYDNSGSQLYDVDFLAWMEAQAAVAR